MGPFTPDELARVHKSLENRFVNKRFPQVFAVGMGLALKGRQADEKRGLSICFYVRRKLMPRNKDARLPQHVKIRVKRGRKFFTVGLPTDVVDAGKVVPSGARVEASIAPGVRNNCTGGVWLEWIVAGNPIIQAGLVTVGHAVGFPDDLGAGDLIATIGTGTQHGILVDKARVNQNRVDASIVALFDPAAVSAQAGSFFPVGGPRSLSNVIADTEARASGQSITLSQRVVNFQLEVYSVSFPLASVGVLKNVVRVRSNVTNAFQKGRSGSPWIVLDDAGTKHLALVQVATDLATGNTVGYGQILDGAGADWATARIEEEPAVVPGSAGIVGYI